MINKEGPKNLFRILHCRTLTWRNSKEFWLTMPVWWTPTSSTGRQTCCSGSFSLWMGPTGMVWKNFENQTDLEKMDILGEHLFSRILILLTMLYSYRCSDGYNFNLYKPHLQDKPNSQGREQLHAFIEICSDSLRLMNYRHFMKFMKVFFAMKNLEQWNEL